MHAGLLESVNNLDVVAINSTTIFISWSPPFTLEGVPIMGYNVTITNTASRKNETMSVEGDTTMLYYSIDHPYPDNNFTVTVVPINEVGAGEVSSPKKFVFPSFLGKRGNLQNSKECAFHSLLIFFNFGMQSHLSQEFHLHLYL